MDTTGNIPASTGLATEPSTELLLALARPLGTGGSRALLSANHVHPIYKNNKIRPAVLERKGVGSILGGGATLDPNPQPRSPGPAALGGVPRMATPRPVPREAERRYQAENTREHRNYRQALLLKTYAKQREQGPQDRVRPTMVGVGPSSLTGSAPSTTWTDIPRKPGPPPGRQGPSSGLLSCSHWELRQLTCPLWPVTKGVEGPSTSVSHCRARPTPSQFPQRCNLRRHTATPSPAARKPRQRGPCGRGRRAGQK